MLHRVTFLRDMASLRSLLVQCDLVLLPSKTMALRTILIEAMLASVPIIATSIDGFDMLIDDETALITNGSWDTAIKRVLDDKKLAQRLATAGSELIAKQYASAAQIAAFEAAFTLI